jgi:DNA-binding transcriptional ArsR family regulator
MVDKFMIYNQEHEAFEPADSLLVTDMAALRIISDKLRAQIIDLLRAGPHTVKQLAGALNLPPKKLYYHINLLEQHGLIRVVQTRLTSGIVEKTYRATAHIFLFDQSVFAATNSPDDASLNPMLTMMFEATKNQLEQSMQDGLVDESGAAAQRRLLTAWNLSRLSPAQAEDFYARLEALLNEFGALDEADDERQAYRLFATLFPVRCHARPAPQTDEESGR